MVERGSGDTHGVVLDEAGDIAVTGNAVVWVLDLTGVENESKL